MKALLNLELLKSALSNFLQHISLRAFHNIPRKIPMTGYFLNKISVCIWEVFSQKFSLSVKINKMGSIKIEKLHMHNIFHATYFFWNSLLRVSEATTRYVLYRKVFLEISQNSQENTCVRVSFLITLQAWGLRLY